MPKPGSVVQTSPGGADDQFGLGWTPVPRIVGYAEELLKLCGNGWRNLRRSDAGLQAREGAIRCVLRSVDQTDLPDLRARRQDRNPHFVIGAARDAEKRRRGDADYREEIGIQPNGLSDHCGVAGKPAPPEVV